VWRAPREVTLIELELFNVDSMAAISRKTRHLLRLFTKGNNVIKAQRRNIGDIWVAGSCIDRTYIYGRHCQYFVR